MATQLIEFKRRLKRQRELAAGVQIDGVAEPLVAIEDGSTEK